MILFCCWYGSGLTVNCCGVQVGVFEVSHRAYSRQESSKQPYRRSPEWIRDFDDAVFYLETKRALYAGPFVAVHAGTEVHEAFERGAALARRDDIATDLEDVFGEGPIDSPDLALETKIIKVEVGIGEPIQYTFQTVSAPGCKPAIILRAESFAAARHQDLRRSLQQGIAFQLLAALSHDTDEASERFRGTWMHQATGRENQLDGRSLVVRVNARGKEAKLSWEAEQLVHFRLADFMLG